MRTAWPQGCLPAANCSSFCASVTATAITFKRTTRHPPGTSDQRPVLAKLAFPALCRTPTVRVADFVHSSAADSNSSRNLCVARKCWLSSSVLAPRAMTPQVATRLRVHDDDAALRARPRRRRRSPAARDPAGPFPVVPMHADEYASAPILWRESLHRRLLGLADVICGGLALALVLSIFDQRQVALQRSAASR